MPIKVHCNCGRTLTLRDEAAGKRLTCPNCNAPILVPSASAPGPELEIELGDEFVVPSSSRYAKQASATSPAPDRGSSLTPVAASRSKGRPKEPWYYKFLDLYAKLLLWLGVIQFAIAFVIGVVMIAFAFMGGSEPASPPPFPVDAEWARRFDPEAAAGPGLAVRLVAASIPILISGAVLFAVGLFVAPILLLVDAARNLRGLRWRED